MRKSFPVPKGLRSPSFASRYAGLRKLRKLANRAEGEEKASKLIPSGRLVPRPDRNASTHRGTSFGHAVAIGILILLAFLVWMAFVD